MTLLPEDIIIRFLQNTINSEEEEILNDWLNENVQNIIVFRRYLEIWDAEKIAPEKKNLTNWEKFRNQLKESEQVVVKPYKTISLNRWLWYAAMLAGIILGTSTLFNVVKKANTELVATHVVENREGVLKHILPDGSIVWLQANSQLSYVPRFEGQTRSVLLKGDAYFEVHKNELQPFIVHLGNVDVKVKGTEFMVHSELGSRIAVTLVTGGVDVDTRNKEGEMIQHVQLQPDQQANIDMGTGAIRVQSVSAGNYAVWKDGTYRFSDEELVDVVQQLSFRFLQEIRLSDNLRNKRITGRGTPQHSLETILENISGVYSLQFRKESGYIYISEKK